MWHHVLRFLWVSVITALKVHNVHSTGLIQCRPIRSVHDVFFGKIALPSSNAKTHAYNYLSVFLPCWQLVTILGWAESAAERAAPALSVDKSLRPFQSVVAWPLHPLAA